jgi:hypothetical protein
MLVGRSRIANKKLSAFAGDMVAGLNGRTPTDTIRRSEVDHMLRDGCLADRR